MSDPVAVNKMAMTNIDKRIKNINKCRAKQQEALSDPAYAKQRDKVKILKKNSDDRLNALAQEKAIREELAGALASGNQQQVASVSNKLAEHKKNILNFYGKKQKIGDPCFKCGAGLKGLRDPTYPLWNDYTKKRNPNGGGWLYSGTSSLSVKKYKGWDELIKSGKKTESEKKVITSVASNEGKFDTVQTYDSEVVSIGVMQKTVNAAKGEGELPKQIMDFKKEYPEKYKELFEDKGWSVQRDLESKVVKGKAVEKLSKPRLYYKTPDIYGSHPMTGEKLKEYLNKKSDPEAAKKALTSLKKAGEDPNFQRQQVMDYNQRVLDAITVNPKKYNHPIKSYITSERGTALVLDQSVNAPGNLPKNMGQALDKFYKKYPNADKNPANWGNMRQQYEDEILSSYKQNRRMTASAARCKHIMKEGSLSDKILSMEVP
jgi:hypothetical protein